MLDESQGKLVMKEMEALSSLIAVLEHMGAAGEDVAELKKSIEQLKDLFLLVIVGEFNSGKSSFLNAMLGKKWLEEGVTPTTAQVNILRNGKEFKTFQVAASSAHDEHVEVHVPVPWLKQISLVDTPGTNAVVQGHQEITEDFVPRSDLVLFVTSCDRAFTESERTFLELVKQYNKKVVVVLSKIDMLENPEKELPQILHFVNEQTKRLFGFVPQIFPVSSRKALRAKAAETIANLHGEQRDLALQQNADWNESRFGPLESYILHTLNAKERGKLKLENPIGIAEHFIKKYQSEHQQKSIIIRDDVQTLERIDNELEAFRAEMMKEYAYHEERIDNVLLSLTERARNFLDDELVLTNGFKLMRAEQMKEEFERKVVGDAPVHIDNYINEMIDWLLSKQAKQWSRVVEYAAIRQETSKKVIGNVRSQYSYNRALLIGNLGGGAKQVVGEFDKKKEAEMIAATVKAAIFQTAAFEVGVVGIVCAWFKGLLSPSYYNPQLSVANPENTVVPFWDVLTSPLIQGGWITVSLLDVTGILGVATAAAFGLAWLPYKKRQIIHNLNAQISEIRIKLKASLKTHFDHELQKGISELKDNIAPYYHLVHSEKVKLEASGSKLEQSAKDFSSLRASIHTAFTSL